MTSTLIRTAIAALAGVTAAAALSVPAQAAPGGGDVATPQAKSATLAAVSPGPTITRTEIIARAQTWVAAQVPYSMDAYYGGYRTDCSGYVSMALKTNGSYWTGNLAEIGTPIAFTDLKPGDFLNYHNVSNPNNGSHVVLFDKWVGAVGGDFWMYEQTPPRTIHRKWSDTSGRVRTNYKPYRYTKVIDDGAPNLGVFEFHLSDSLTSSSATRSPFSYGNSPMTPIKGDWDGDGSDTVSTFDKASGKFFVSNDPATGDAQYVVPFGNPGEGSPFTGDWNGDGKDQVGTRMGGTFFLRTTDVSDPAEAATSIAFGDATDVPLAGDWDGNGTDEIGVYRPSEGRFYLRQADGSTVTVLYGNPGSAPLVGDWNNDGKDNVGVRMGNTYFFRTSEVTSAAETTSTVAYGNGNGAELPIIGDWNGDGTDTQGIVF
ncbi:hypothetical protein [Actinoplanes sp. NBRC 103695]|uniref:hypothetical protein n=1 Tax=Actinoplanes sp. NBRC 103695 TaxID=3032202 RepID=UPI0024A19CBD|nr:hypothetical protein [Actinoplanes sp. NBRC 103695]GLZ00105.1 hypothetical protein Acsp02_73570 [Actinoplanes sp. NBRC 103695]